MSGGQEYQIPAQFVIDELHDRLRAKETELVAAGARIRQFTDEVRVLTETIHGLQKQVDELTEERTRPRPRPV